MQRTRGLPGELAGHPNYKPRSYFFADKKKKKKSKDKGKESKKKVRPELGAEFDSCEMLHKCTGSFWISHCAEKSQRRQARIFIQQEETQAQLQQQQLST